MPNRGRRSHILSVDRWINCPAVVFFSLVRVGICTGSIYDHVGRKPHCSSRDIPPASDSSLKSAAFFFQDCFTRRTDDDLDYLDI